MITELLSAKLSELTETLATVLAAATCNVALVRFTVVIGAAGVPAVLLTTSVPRVTPVPPKCRWPC